MSHLGYILFLLFILFVSFSAGCFSVKARYSKDDTDSKTAAVLFILSILGSFGLLISIKV